jgi:rhodanese-related sulfurtransferase
MRIRSIGHIATVTVAFATLIALPHSAHAGGGNIYQATLGEHNPATPEISTGQLREILANRSAMVIDSRPHAQFDAGHIPDAYPLDAAPDKQVAAIEKMTSGNKAAALVLYCNGPFCQASRRLGKQLVAAGFTNVRRYQLGIPIWRALGGPTAVELGGIVRIFNIDRTAVFLDVRAPGEFTAGSIAGARNAPVEDIISGKLKKMPLPEDDFNRRIVLFGRDGAQARKLADLLSRKPWHNVSYFPGSFAALAAALNGSNGHNQPR